MAASSSVTSESRNFETTSESDLVGLYCPTCNIGFEREDLFKQHYHSDIHNYNMKRKIVGLKPASEAQFQKQLLKMQVEKEKSEKKQQAYYCEVLNQKFSNYATYSSRLTTKKYKQALEEKKNKTPVPETMEETKEPEVVEDNILSGQAFKKKKEVLTTLDKLSICLFTNTDHGTFEENLVQMRKEFNFFIPDEHCCTKKEELVRFLATQIQKEFSCIYCFHKFKSGESTQKHIQAKQHALMNEEYFAQYEKFYDFREENKRVIREMAERFKNYGITGDSVRRLKADPNTDITPDAQPAAESADDDEWEDDESSEGAQDATTKKLYEKYNIRRAKRLETGELLLPNGKIAGHRAYVRYYRQQLRTREPDRQPIGQILSDPHFTKHLSTNEQRQMVAFSQKLGETTLSLKTYNHFMNKLKIKSDNARRSDTIRVKRNYVRLGVEAKKLQKYFRDRNIIFG